MLILTRRPGESIMMQNNDSAAIENSNSEDNIAQGSPRHVHIGNELVKITVLGVKGNQVRIGIDAPNYIDVHREEVYRRIQEETETNSDVDEYFE